MEKKVLIVMDYINEIIHPEGKFKGKGYANFAIENNTLSNVADAVNIARLQNIPIVYVKVGFSSEYNDQPKNSPLFGKAHEFQALKLDTWATKFHETLDVRENDEVITKKRVSPFYGTNLEDYLKQNKISEIFLCGVSTDLVVQSAVRDAHDRDYKVFVLSDCCAASNIEDHINSLKTLMKIAQVGNYKELL
jgi:ureidoacrylate peracid hydrolase